ncbi:MAG TPA: thioredoxin family protein [Treponemataceae bacterium]|nr:thioredoxin family protein [Treponemataceae bacterium]
MIHTIAEKRTALFISFCILIFTTIFFNSCNKETFSWETDYETAISIAKQKDKAIFVVFTGLAWDHKSALVKKQILDNNDFMKTVAKSFVLLSIDIDGNDETVPADIAEFNYFLALTMGIQSMPAFLLLTKNGIPFTQLQTGEFTTAEGVLALIQTNEKSVSKFLELENSIEKKEGMQKIKAIDAMYTNLPIQYRLLMRDTIHQIPKLDPENKSGLLGKYKLQIAYSDAQSYLEKNDIEGAVNCFSILTETENLLTKEDTQEVFYSIAFLAAKSGKPNKEVIELLEKSYDAAPESDKAKQLLEIIEQLGAAQKAENSN